jgi:hypothetical protein
MKIGTSKLGPHVGTTGCADARQCPICHECTSFDYRLAKCAKCYPKVIKGQRHRCYCAQVGADKLAREISKQLDRPMWDPEYQRQANNLPQTPGNLVAHGLDPESMSHHVKEED